MGTADWEVSASKGMITRAGHVRFFVQYIQAIVILSQTLDTRNHPQIKDLQLEMGNIQVNIFSIGSIHAFNSYNFDFYHLHDLFLKVRSDGAGTFDYVIEFLVNILPNLLRYQIMDALESPVKAKIQDEMNKINVERLIKHNIPNVDKLRQNYSLTISDLKF